MAKFFIPVEFGKECKTDYFLVNGKDKLDAAHKLIEYFKDNGIKVGLNDSRYDNSILDYTIVKVSEKEDIQLMGSEDW